VTFTQHKLFRISLLPENRQAEEPEKPIPGEELEKVNIVAGLCCEGKKPAKAMLKLSAAFPDLKNQRHGAFRNASIPGQPLGLRPRRVTCCWKQHGGQSSMHTHLSTHQLQPSTAA